MLGIVNRRNSDLTDKADGVMYTSDGRDVEMSVASTKAFYAQVAAGVLLACAITEAANVGSAQRRHDLLTSLRQMPDALLEVLSRRDVIGDAARRFAPSKRYWAIVGSGPNTVAAEEVRIKLSELCYKSIACDITEDKKHIDLSSEPLILVCAAGLVGGTADDVAKEVAIYKAHKATPIVVATEGDERFAAAAAVLTVPAVDSALAFVLSAMVGHLFGYEAALAIDASARPLREAREVIEHALIASDNGDDVLRTVRQGIGQHAERFGEGLRSGLYDGHLEASTAVRLSALLADLRDDLPLEAYQRATGKVATPGVMIDDLTASLTRAIEELTRPVDAIKHQAKTVTVGISRSDEGVLDRALVQATLGGRRRPRCADLPHPQGARRPRSGGRSVVGFTRYRIEGDPASGDASDLDRRPRRAVQRGTQPGRAQPATGRYQAARRRGTPGARRPRTQRRPHGHLRARGEVRRRARASPCCTCSSTIGCRPPSCAASCRATTVATTGSSTGCRRPRASSATTLLGELPVADLLILRSPRPPISGVRDSRDRHRRRRHRAVPPIAGTHAVDASAALHRATSSPTSRRRPIRCRRWRRGSRRAKR